MARSSITYEDVIGQIEKLMNNRENPTIEKIRLGLGSRGSNSTISKYINAWKINNKASTLLASEQPTLAALNTSIHDHYLVDIETLKKELIEARCLGEERRLTLLESQETVLKAKEQIGRLEERIRQLKRELELMNEIKQSVF